MSGLRSGGRQPDGSTPLLLAAHVTLLAGTPPAAEQTDQFAGVYLCTPEASGGVAYSGGKWVGTSFSLEVPMIITLKPVGPTSDVDMMLAARPVAGHRISSHDRDGRRKAASRLPD